MGEAGGGKSGFKHRSPSLPLSLSLSLHLIGPESCSLSSYSQQRFCVIFSFPPPLNISWYRVNVPSTILGEA